MVRPDRPIALHATFGFEPIEQFLDGGMLRTGTLRIDRFGDLTNGDRAAFPEDLEHRQFRVGDVALRLSHGGDRLQSSDSFRTIQTPCLECKRVVGRGQEAGDREQRWLDN